MQDLYRSELLRSLGWAIANSLWQMSLIWLVYQVFIAIPYRKKPVVRHLAAFSLLVLGSAWFIYSFIERVIHEQAGPGSSIATAPVSVTFSNVLNSALPYLSTAYLLILVLLFARLVYNFISTQQLKTQLKPAGDWQNVVNRLTVSLGISRDVLIYVSERISVPSTIGYLKPIILIPIATMNQLSLEQLEAVIIHEMAHIRRNDYLVNLAVSFIETILFFNPFAHLLCQSIRKDCELCCDDEVVRQQDPESYAQALLLLEKAKLKPTLALAVTGKQGMLLGRVKRILNIPDQEVKYRHKLLALVLLAGLIMGTAILAPTKTSSVDRQKTQVAAANVIHIEQKTAPLPFMIKVPPAAASRPKQKLVIREVRKAEVKPDRFDVPAHPEETEFVFFPEVATHPALPDAPPPPVPPADWGKAFGSMISEELAISPNAPDPRDKRSPDILQRSRPRRPQPPMVHADAFKPYVDQPIHFQELENIEESIAKAGQNEKELMRNAELNQMRYEQLVSPPQVKMIRGKAIERAQISPRVKTSRNEKGMTITIIQNDEQIEITVKDSR